MTKNIKLVFGASALAILGLSALGGCSSDAATGGGAGAATAGAPAGGAHTGGAGGGSNSAGAPSAGASMGGASAGAATAGASMGGASAGAGSAMAGAGGSTAGAGGAAAGAGGMGAGGAPSASCGMFCKDEKDTCTFTDAMTGAYKSEGACQSACAGFAPGTVGATSGDTFACRRYHLSAAGMGMGDMLAANKQTHCAHTGLLSKAALADMTATGPCK